MEFFRRIRQSQRLKQKLEESRERLYRVAYSWCHEPHLADDLVQQTLVKALQKVGQLREMEVIDSWLFRILTNCWHDHFRRQREMLDIDEVSWSHDRTPESEHGRDEVISRVRQAIATLPMQQRQVITLVDLGGLTYTEVADVLGIPIGTVMSRVCRARRALKERLLDLNPVQDETKARIRRIK
jgi:RNA polymerase sigma-70 factor (ECF subfamily)